MPAVQNQPTPAPASPSPVDSAGKLTKSEIINQRLAIKKAYLANFGLDWEPDENDRIMEYWDSPDDQVLHPYQPQTGAKVAKSESYLDRIEKFKPEETTPDGAISKQLKD